MGAIVGTDDYFRYSNVPDIGFRTGFLQSYRIGASGGNESLTYSVSGNIYNDNSFQEGIEQRRYNIRGSLNARISNKANYTFSSAFTSNNFDRLNNANSSFDVFNGLDFGILGDPTTWDEEDVEDAKSLVSDLAKLSNITEGVVRFQTSHGFVYNPTENITINFNLGLDYRFSRQRQIQTNAFWIRLGVYPAGTTNQGSIELRDRNFLTTTGSLNTQWNKKLGEFSFLTSLGGQFFRDIDKQLSITANNVTEGSQSINNSATRAAADFLAMVTNYGVYATENIGYKNRYFLDLGVRVDYNTAFGEDVGGQVFPRAGLSYVISDETFMQGLSSVVSSAKLRVSYGEAGNFPPPFTRDKLIMVSAFDGGQAYQPGQPGDPNLKPERTKTLEYGADFSLWNNRIGLGITYFDARTVDALFTAPFASSNGNDNQTRNLGEISNKGFEISSNFNLVSNNNWDLSISASYNSVSNKVESSGGAAEFTIGGFSFLGAFVKEGFPVGYFRGSRPTFASDGTLAEVQENANLGSPIPDAFGNLGINLSYKKKLQLFISGDYQFGSEIINTNEVLRFFRGLGDSRIPDASLGESFFDLAGVWVQNGNYLKVRNIALTYTLPNAWFGNRVRNATLGFSALNPFNFVGSKYVDPELTGAGAPGLLPGTNTPAQGIVTVGGFHYGTFSAPRQFIGTLRFTF
jgi:outer membrane receptor protein involved in Fe transport